MFESAFFACEYFGNEYLTPDIDVVIAEIPTFSTARLDRVITQATDSVTRSVVDRADNIRATDIV